MVIMDGVREEDLVFFFFWKRWELEFYLYVFFNDDYIIMIFIGFYLQFNINGSVDVISYLIGKVIKRDVMIRDLYQGLLFQRVFFNVDFDKLFRYKKFERFCLILGIFQVIDFDKMYEFIIDNMFKIFVIEMWFWCGILVIIMGEIGCGKIRFIKFFSDLWCGGINVDIIKLVKVYGGIIVDMIYFRVREVENVVFVNKD